MTKLLSPVLVEFGHNRVGFWCPACESPHVLPVSHTQDAVFWSYNGNTEAPTFLPSVKITTGRAVDPSFIPEPGDPPEVCHSYVISGRISYLHDCTHALAGQIRHLPLYPIDE